MTIRAAFAETTGIAHGVALASGSAVLHLAMKLLGVEPGDEVTCRYNNERPLNGPFPPAS